MEFWRNDLTKIFLLFLILLLAGGCVQPRPEPPDGPYYLDSGISYLRDIPTYQGYIVGQLYRGDQVDRLAANDQGWWRVRSQRTHQLGWVQGELFSRSPVSIVYYYVIPDTLELRECPTNDCPPLHLLFRGDQVQKIEENDQGWWRVLILQTRNLGWAQAINFSDQSGADLPESPKDPFYYVAVKRVELHLKPVMDSAIVKTLQFNDRVKPLEENPWGWVKVSHPPSGTEGWVIRRNLESSQLKFPRPEVFIKSPRMRKPIEPEPM
jgi:uncharacterized protein YgiM (DUF1202 family)